MQPEFLLPGIHHTKYIQNICATQLQEKVSISPSNKKKPKKFYGNLTQLFIVEVNSVTSVIRKCQEHKTTVSALKKRSETLSLTQDLLLSLHHLKMYFKVCFHFIYLHKNIQKIPVGCSEQNITYNCFKSDIPGTALEMTDLWFHLVAQLMLLHGHMD